MFRIWGKLWSSNHLLSDSTICNDDRSMSRTKKIYAAIDTFCRDFDLAVPIWLDTNIKEFKKHAKTRFNKDNFVDEIDFDFFEIQVLEEDESL